ncbi:MAG: hypothetical protein DME10_17015 [Candidatus Rokuibacteriota bacterium]|nr:MAG: hypothetical protein DME10_17015 [Candidatus Rokubacteria bacterium]
MLTRVDHVMVCVTDLEPGIEAYRRLGFNIHPGGVHTGRGTHNAIAFFEEDYLEVMGVRDRQEYLSSAGPGGGLLEFLSHGDGLRFVIVQSDDLGADVAAMRRRGVEVGEPSEGGRRTPAGHELRWKMAVLGPAHPLPVLDVAAAAKAYSQVLGVPVPPIQRGAVIKADMAVFDLGPTGLTVAQPAEPGPAAEALRRRGPGPFQVLYRTSSMDGAARWMADHGVPPPARGVRNTGEQAMLVSPEHACGTYIGFVGPA